MNNGALISSMRVSWWFARTPGSQTFLATGAFFSTLTFSIFLAMTSELLPIQLPDGLVVGQTVYIPGFRGHRKGQVVETKINSFNVVLFKDRDTLRGIVESVEVSDCDFSRGDNFDTASTYRPDEVYTTKQAAEHAAIFRAIKCNGDDWQKITGCLESGSRMEEPIDGPAGLATIDNCELPACCSDISAIRDILVSAWQQGGLYQVEVARLQALIENHEAPTSINRLNSVLAQVGITWH